MTGPIVVRLTGAAVARGLPADPGIWGELLLADVLSRPAFRGGAPAQRASSSPVRARLACRGVASGGAAEIDIAPLACTTTRV